MKQDVHKGEDVQLCMRYIVYHGLSSSASYLVHTRTLTIPKKCSVFLPLSVLVIASSWDTNGAVTTNLQTISDYLLLYQHRATRSELRMYRLRDIEVKMGFLLMQI